MRQTDIALSAKYRWLVLTCHQRKQWQKNGCVKSLQGLFFPRGLFTVMLNGLSKRYYTSSNLIVQIMIYGLYALTCTKSVSINITMIWEMRCTMWHRKFAGVQVASWWVLFCRILVLRFWEVHHLCGGINFWYSASCTQLIFNQDCATSH